MMLPIRGFLVLVSSCWYSKEKERRKGGGIERQFFKI